MTTQTHTTKTPITAADLMAVGNIRYMMWVAGTQAFANHHVGQPYFCTHDLNNVRAILDQLAKYRGKSFASILDIETGSVVSGQDF